MSVFLIHAAKDPLAHPSPNWVTIYSSIAHVGIMRIQALVGETDRVNLLGDVPALILIAFALWHLMSKI